MMHRGWVTCISTYLISIHSIYYWELQQQWCIILLCIHSFLGYQTFSLQLLLQLLEVLGTAFFTAQIFAANLNSFLFWNSTIVAKQYTVYTALVLCSSGLTEHKPNNCLNMPQVIQYAGTVQLVFDSKLFHHPTFHSLVMDQSTVHACNLDRNWQQCPFMLIKCLMNMCCVANIFNLKYSLLML